jgi:hypothetical protein
MPYGASIRCDHCGAVSPGHAECPGPGGGFKRRTARAAAIRAQVSRPARQVRAAILETMRAHASAAREALKAQRKAELAYHEADSRARIHEAQGWGARSTWKGARQLATEERGSVNFCAGAVAMARRALRLSADLLRAVRALQKGTL